MKCLWALLAWGAACPTHGAVLPQRGANQRDATKQVAFLSRRSGAHSSGEQPWLYNPPAASLPRSKPLEIPGDPLVLPPVDKMWGMQPSMSPPTIAPPEKEGDVGLQATVPPRSLEGWYATIPPEMIANGLVDNRTAYYVRCLGGPYPCPMTVPPAIQKFWARVTPGKTFSMAGTPAGAIAMDVLANVGFAVGASVMIEPNTPVMEVRTIKGFGSFIFDRPLQFAHDKGCQIVIMAATTFPPMPVPPPWASFQPFGAWNAFTAPFPGPAPGPAPGPFPFMLSPHPVPVPAPAPLMFIPGAPAPGPAPLGGAYPGPSPAVSPGAAPGGAPSPGPAPVR